jgi:hypothetical protein
MDEMTKYNERHGGAFDRGSADAYYRRAYQPHMYNGATGSSLPIPEHQMKPEDIEAYRAGYDEQMASGIHKDYR